MDFLPGRRAPRVHVVNRFSLASARRKPWTPASRIAVEGLESRMLLSADAALVAGVREFAAPSGQSVFSGITAGPDGNVWFTSTVNQVGRITPAGVFSKFDDKGTSANTIALGSDGNLWLAEPNSGIARITPGGVVTKFPTTLSANPLNIAAGPDGNLWFTGYTSNIGRITPAGKITYFPAGNGTGSLKGITQGPDGAMWFIHGFSIGRITMAGKITEAKPDFVNVPGQSITQGSDGNLWYLCPNTNSVGRVTPQFKFTFFKAPSPGAAKFSAYITRGPDGAVWFTDSQGGGIRDQIWRITPAGSFTSYTVPTVIANVQGITTGPDGNIWFTEGGTDPGQIGEIELRHPIPAVEGVATGSKLITTFSDLDPTGAVAQFKATINWGDGTTSAGTIAKLPGKVFGVSGSHVYAEEGHFGITVSVKDSGGSTFTSGGDALVSGVLPFGKISTPPVIVAKAASTTFTVTFTDDIGLKLSSIATGDILVTGPGGFSQMVVLVGTTSTAGGKSATASFRISAPGGSWKSSANGNYSINLKAAKVSDTAGNFADAVVLGTFKVAI